MHFRAESSSADWNLARSRRAGAACRGSLDRRALLQIALSAGCGWGTAIAELLARGATPAGATGSATRSLILVWLAGGPSQLETFDPHPGKAIAGGTGSIASSSPGVAIAAGLPRLAERMHDLSLIRSMTTREGDHFRAFYLAKTGYPQDPVTIHPSIGAIVCHELPVGETEIPRHVSILAGSQTDAAVAGRGGYLGGAFDAFRLGDPAQTVPDLKARVSLPRYRHRLADLEMLERQFGAGRAPAVAEERQVTSHVRQMMSSEQVRAFRIEDESAETRRRYGETPFGRGLLAARRLIQVGVRCVEVTLHGWDSHVDNHDVHKRLNGELDPALSALLGDLHEHALWSQTLVACGGEFGRTPKINLAGGRDHWLTGFSFLLGGGLIRPQVTVGSTDPEGSRNVAEPHTFADLHATLLAALGIDPARELRSTAGRPIKLSEGSPILPLLPG